jgi:hypothetical protein
MPVSPGKASGDDAPVIEITHECLLTLIHFLINHTIILNLSSHASI